MKAFIFRQISVLRSLSIPSDTLRVSSWIFSLMISAYLLINLSIPLFQSSTHKGYVFATDNDGGRAIEVSMATKWYNSNHFAPYGNLYYRFSSTLADLIQMEDENLTPQEAKEKAHHFSLKMISLFSLFGLGLFLGWSLFGTIPVVPLFGTLFTLSAVKMPMWAEWVYRPHPEHLLNLFIVISIYMFAKLLTEKENRRTFILSAFCWGLAMAVKRSTSMFIPGIMILLLFPLSKDNFKITAKYIGYMLLAYLVIGFPQNFGFYKHIKFLVYESSLHSMGDFESVSTNLKLVWDQLVYLVPVVILGIVFSQNKRKYFSLKLLVFILLSFIPVLMRKVSFQSDHHTMPLAVAGMMAMFVLTIHYLPWRINSNLALFVLLLMGIKVVGISPTYFEWKKTGTSCFKEFDQITTILSSQVSSDSQLVKEPYSPYNEKIGKFTSTYWGLDWSKVSSSVKFIGITRTSLNQHLQDPPNDYYGKRLLNWDEKKLFYSQFKDQKTVTSPSGVVFEKAFNNVTCDYELWMAKND